MSPARRLFLVIAFLSSLVSVFVLDLTHDTYGELLETHPPDTIKVLDGTFAKRSNDYLASYSWTMRRTRPYWNEAMLAGFHHTPPSIVVGRHDWLFAVTSLLAIDPVEGPRCMEDMLTAVLRLHQAAQRFGATFVPFVIPSKWRLHEDEIVGPPVPASRRALYSEIMRNLKALGVGAPNVLEEMRAVAAARPGARFFVPNDTHMGREGFHLLAQHSIAPRLGVLADEAGRRLDAHPFAPEVHSGNLPLLMSIRPDGLVGRRCSVTETRIDLPHTADRVGCEVAVFGDSYGSYYDFLYPRLVQALTGLTVDARRCGWNTLPAFMRAVAEWQKAPPKFILAMLTEKRFGGDA